VISLVFGEGHFARTGPSLVRADLCDEAIRLARSLTALLPDEPEAQGLLALLLLTDARRAARIDEDGELVLLAEQNRDLWDRDEIAEGARLLEAALARGRPGTYQVSAAIAACHDQAATAHETDWRQIAALYNELLRYEPTPVVEANRAVAVAMAEGPAEGLVILDALEAMPQLRTWPRLHIARADLLTRLGRRDDAIAAFEMALRRDPSPIERRFILRQVGVLRRR
jgi:RNA polymerase sigma-70 factor (ECF subfamily)